MEARHWTQRDRGIQLLAMVLFASVIVKVWVDYKPPAPLLMPLLQTLVFATFVAAYGLRTAPRVRSQGLAEVVLPYVSSALPMALIFCPDHQWYMEPGPMNPLLAPGCPLRLALIVVLVVLGDLLMVAGLLTLLKSFSIRVEVRDLVTTGLYRHVRHPIYIGEMCLNVGVALSRWGAAAAAIMGLALVLQVYRAFLEERKLRTALPEYEEYRVRTGMFWPRFKR